MTRPQYRKAIMKDPRFKWTYASCVYWPALVQDVALTYFVKDYPEDELADETRKHLLDLWMSELHKETL